MMHFHDIGRLLLAQDDYLLAVPPKVRLCRFELVHWQHPDRDRSVELTATLVDGFAATHHRYEKAGMLSRDHHER